MNAKRKLRGVRLLAAIYEELDRNFRDEEISREELLEAAQSLADLSKQGYVTNTHPDGSRRHGYYSADVSMMMEKHQWRILANEPVESDGDLPSNDIDYYLKKILGDNHG